MIFFFLLLLTLLSLPAAAQLAELELNPLKIELAGRPLGLGGGFTGLADDLHASLFNPAGLAWAKGISLSMKDPENLVALQAYPVGNNSAFGFVVATSKIADMPITGGVANSNSTVVLLSYGTKLNVLPRQAENKLFQKIGIGVNFKGLVGQTLRRTGQIDRSATGWDLDLGVLYKGEEWWSAGVTLQNFLPSGTLGGGTIKWDVGGSDGIPAALKIGGAARVIGDLGSPVFMEGRQLRVAGDLSISPAKALLFRLGGEFILDNVYFLRTGLQQQYRPGGGATDINFGAGYRNDVWGADIASYREPLNDQRALAVSVLYFPKDWIILRELDLDRPKVWLEQPIEAISLADNITTYDDKLEITGRVKPGVQVFINGLPVTIAADNSFKTIVPLRLEKNLIVVEARYLGEKRAWKYKVLRKAKVNIVDKDKVKDLEKKKETVESLVTMGVIEVKPDANFVMEAGITRGELASWLVKSAGQKLPKVNADLFSDVPRTHPLAPYVKVVVDLKLLPPFADGTFRPNAVVSKAEGDAIFAKFGAP